MANDTTDPPQWATDEARRVWRECPSYHYYYAGPIIARALVAVAEREYRRGVRRGDELRSRIEQSKHDAKWDHYYAGYEGRVREEKARQLLCEELKKERGE